MYAINDTQDYVNKCRHLLYYILNYNYYYIHFLCKDFDFYLSQNKVNNIIDFNEAAHCLFWFIFNQSLTHSFCNCSFLALHLH
jgi:hypothetical protein